MSEAELSARTEDSKPLEDWELLEENVMALVSRPSEVFVKYNETEDSAYFVIHVAPEDIGKVIGKNGDTVSLLRKLLGRVAASRGKRVMIDVYDPRRQPTTTTYRRGFAA